MKKVLLNTILTGFVAAIVLNTIFSIQFSLVDYLLVFLMSMFVYIIEKYSK